MGCTNNNRFRYISTTDDIIATIKEENIKLENDLISSGIVFRTDTTSRRKEERIRNFLKLSEVLIEMINNKTVYNLNAFGSLLNNCYQNIFDSNFDKSSIYLKRTYKYLTRYPPK